MIEFGPDGQSDALRAPSPEDVPPAAEPAGSIMDVIPIVPAAPAPPRRRGLALLSWFLILGMVVAIPAARTWFAPDEGHDGRSDIVLSILELQGKLMVGASEFAGKQPSGFGGIGELPDDDQGTLEQRLRMAILTGDLGDFRKAKAQLDALKAKVDASDVVQKEETLQTLDALQRLYGDYNVGRFNMPSVDERDRTTIRSNLGWFGKLALTPKESMNPEEREAIVQPARVMFGVSMIIFATLALFGFAGSIALLIVLVCLLVGYLKRGVNPSGNEGGIYAETFALWMVLYVILLRSAAYVPFPQAQWITTFCAQLLSLGALGWPVLRGIPWSRVRADIGLTWGRAGVLEPLLGPVGNILSLPLLAVALPAMFILQLVLRTTHLGLPVGAMGDDFSPVDIPAHPLIGSLKGASWWELAQILFVASVAAPIVEETFFRGVLYRQVREATRRWPYFLSFAASGLLVSFIFAAIHPQGLLGIPLLMALAGGFTIMREWRGSLISCIVAHGINNALVLALATFFFSS
jgi:membrane protease YdiL (CAAX protease family)